ncbi:hypothetical protein ACLEPN_05780 [Myxococcus sp. 1LA]
MDAVTAAGELALTQQEAAFLQTSRRALRRTFARRLGLALALPLTAMVAGGATWLKGRHALERTVQAHLEEARASITEARAHHAAAKAARTDAFQQWDARGARASPVPRSRETEGSRKRPGPRHEGAMAMPTRPTSAPRRRSTRPCCWTARGGRPATCSRRS